MNSFSPSLALDHFLKNAGVFKNESISRFTELVDVKDVAPFADRVVNEEWSVVADLVVMKHFMHRIRPLENHSRRLTTRVKSRTPNKGVGKCIQSGIDCI